MESTGPEDHEIGEKLQELSSLKNQDLQWKLVHLFPFSLEGITSDLEMICKTKKKGQTLEFKCQNKKGGSETLHGVHRTRITCKYLCQDEQHRWLEQE